MSSVIARVLWKRDRPAAAVSLTIAAALALGTIAADDLAKLRVFPLQAGLPAFTLVALLFLVVALAPWFVPSTKARSSRVTCTPGKIRVGDREIEAKDVTAFSLARAARGLSIAIQRGSDVVFLEVDRDEDALSIARALEENPLARRGAIEPRARSRVLVLAQAVATLGLLVCAPLYWAGATGTSSGKELFGIGGLLLAFFATVNVVLQRLVSTKTELTGASAFATHATLHRTSAPPVITPPATASPLGRGDEPVGAWLDRLDKLPTNEGAYRALPREVLLDVLSDDEATPDARMGAARVLRRRYNEPESIVRVVADPDVRIRVEAAADGDVEEAEEKIERLGPLFRAR